MQAVSEAELLKIDEALENIGISMSASMSCVRKVQGRPFDPLTERFIGIKASLLQHYILATPDLDVTALKC